VRRSVLLDALDPAPDGRLVPKGRRRTLDGRGYPALSPATKGLINVDALIPDLCADLRAKGWSDERIDRELEDAGGRGERNDDERA
jgi:hypothetical protein